MPSVSSATPEITIMTQPQTLEQWLAAEEQKQKTRNFEPEEEISSIPQQELIAQINHLNLELAQEKRISQIFTKKWKEAEREVVKKQKEIVCLTGYQNREKNDKLVNILTILLLSLPAVSFTIYFFKPKEEEEKKQITNF